MYRKWPNTLLWIPLNDVQLTRHSPTIMPVQYGPQLDFGYLYLSGYKLKECCSNFGKTCSIKEHLLYLEPKTQLVTLKKSINS